jgi:hypothetical protein
MHDEVHNWLLQYLKCVHLPEQIHQVS